jgi:hypothetical protein
MNRLSPTASAVLGLACATALLSPAAASAEEAAPTAAPGARSCFSSGQISNFAASGDQALNLRVGVGDYYQLKLLGRCLELPWAQAIGLQTRRGADFVCSGLDVTVIVPRPGGGRERCMATDLRKLTPEEVNALPPKEKP